MTRFNDIDRATPSLRLQHASPKSLRVAVDLSTMRRGGENGGVKPFVLEYVKALAELEGRDLSLIFLTWSCSHAEVRALARPWDELICVRHTDSSPIPAEADWLKGEILLLNPPPDLLLRLGVDILYSPLSSSEYACPGIPLISTVVDVLHRDYPATLTQGDFAEREANFQALVRASSLFQCISEYTAQRMAAHYGVESRRLFRTHIVIHHRLPEPAKDWSVPTLQPYFLYPANAWQHKNHATLLVAYRLYQQKAGAQAWDLVLTGHEDDRMRAVIATARVLGLQDRVHFCGHLPLGEFATLWDSASALVFPSLHEGFGIPILEAMHFNLPILCSRAGALPEVAADAALYVDALNPLDLAEGLARLSSDETLRTELIARGRLRLNNFSLQQEASEFCRMLRSATAVEPPLWSKGIHTDGWIERQAIIALPRHDQTCQLRIELGAAPAARRLRVRLGRTFHGGFDLVAGIPHVVNLDVQSDGEPLVLEVPDAGNLNPLDHRCHGVIVAGIALVDAGGGESRLTHIRS